MQYYITIINYPNICAYKVYAEGEISMMQRVCMCVRTYSVSSIAYLFLLQSDENLVSLILIPYIVRKFGTAAILCMI